MQREINIREAEFKDIVGILIVQEERLLVSEDRELIKKDIIKSRRKSREGFLSYSINKKELEEAIRDKENNIILIAYKGSNVIGYVLAYDLELWKKLKPDWEGYIDVDESIRKSLNLDSVLYFRHVARRKGYSGIGKKLENVLFEKARSKGYEYLIAEIMEEPISTDISIKLHKERGFRRIGSLHYPDETIWGLWKKVLM